MAAAIDNVRDVKTSHLKCKSRLTNHRWILTQAPRDQFRKARERGGTLITMRCANCNGWRYRRIHGRTAEWLDEHWRYVTAIGYKTTGLTTQDFRKELLRRGLKQLDEQKLKAG